jgi:hypothetical protein
MATDKKILFELGHVLGYDSFKGDFVDEKTAFTKAVETLKKSKNPFLTETFEGMSKGTKIGTIENQPQSEAVFFVGFRIGLMRKISEKVPAFSDLQISTDKRDWTLPENSKELSEKFLLSNTHFDGKVDGLKSLGLWDSMLSKFADELNAKEKAPKAESKTALVKAYRKKCTELFPLLSVPEYSVKMKTADTKETQIYGWLWANSIQKQVVDEHSMFLNSVEYPEGYVFFKPENGEETTEGEGTENAGA